MGSRVTKATAEVLSLANPQPRVTKATIEVLSGAEPKPRVTKASLEVLYTVGTGSATQQPVIVICT